MFFLASYYILTIAGLKPSTRFAVSPGEGKRTGVVPTQPYGPREEQRLRRGHRVSSRGSGEELLGIREPLRAAWIPYREQRDVLVPSSRSYTPLIGLPSLQMPSKPS